MERGMALTMWVDTIRAGCGGWGLESLHNIRRSMIS
jgi:hypothetical protein